MFLVSKLRIEYSKFSRFQLMATQEAYANWKIGPVSCWLFYEIITMNRWIKSFVPCFKHIRRKDILNLCRRESWILGLSEPIILIQTKETTKTKQTRSQLIFYVGIYMKLTS